MSPTWTGLSMRWTGFPRVSGDEPWDLLMNHDPVLFSPRERG